MAKKIMLNMGINLDDSVLIKFFEKAQKEKHEIDFEITPDMDFDTVKENAKKAKRIINDVMKSDRGINSKMFDGIVDRLNIIEKQVLKLSKEMSKLKIDIKTDNIKSTASKISADIEAEIEPIEIPVIIDNKSTSIESSVLKPEEIGSGTQAIENQTQAVRELSNALDEIDNNESRSLEFGIGVPEDERARIISWFEEVKSTAENIQSISISPKFEIEDNEKILVGYVATVKQLDDETKRIESSVINLNTELGDADGSWNRFTETVKSSTNAAKEFNVEFQRELATQQIDTLKAKLGELPFNFQKVEEASKNIVDKKSLESFNNELTLTKERIKTAQAEVKNENSLSAFTAMEKNLERIPTKIEVLEERVKRFASVEGFDKVSSDIVELYNILEKVDTAKANKDIEGTTKAYDELTSAISRVKEQMLLLGARMQSGNFSPVANEITLEIQALFDLLKNADTKFNTVADKTSEAKVKVDGLVAAFRELNKEGVDTKFISNFEDLATILNKKFEFGLSDDGLKQNQDLVKKQVADAKKELSGLDEELKKIAQNKDIIREAVSKESLQRIVEITDRVDTLKAELGDKMPSTTGIDKSLKAASDNANNFAQNMEQLNRDYQELISKFEYFKRHASAAVHNSNFSPIITQFETNLRSAAIAADATSFKPLKDEFKGIELGAKAAGLSSLTMMDLISQGFKKLGSYMINRVIFSSIQNALSTVYKNVIDLDFAMKDLERISGATGQELSQAFEKSGDMAIRLGSSIKDVLGSVGEYSRLGLGIEESLQMAESTALLASSGVMGLDKATQGLISTTRAYNIEAKDTLALVDKIVATDVSQAISSEGILDILQRSSAGFKEANATVEENIALGVAMNSVLQNTEKTGTLLNTMVARIRNTSGALAEMGLETDNTFTSVTQLQQKLYELTNYKLDIMIDPETFRGPFEIIQAISKEWDNISDKSRAEITQILGGVRGAQGISSLISQFSKAEEAIVSMGQSSGKALELNNVIMDTATKKAEQLGASFEKLSQSAIDTTFVKIGLDGLRGFVEVITAINNSTGGLLSAGVAMGTLAAGFKALNTKFHPFEWIKDIGKPITQGFNFPIIYRVRILPQSTTKRSVRCVA